jgi:hypothetical protein
LTKTKNIDRGKLLEDIVEESGMPIAKLVKKLGYKGRGSYYAHIKKPDLPLEILFAYGKVLKYDLSDQFPEVSQFLLQDPEVEYHTKPKTFAEAVELLTAWKEKYYMLLEKYTKLIEKER